MYNFLRNVTFICIRNDEEIIMRRLFIIIILLITASSFAKETINKSSHSKESSFLNDVDFEEHTFRSTKYQLKLIGLDHFEYNIYDYYGNDFPQIESSLLEAKKSSIRDRVSTQN